MPEERLWSSVQSTNQPPHAPWQRGVSSLGGVELPTWSLLTTPRTQPNPFDYAKDGPSRTLGGQNKRPNLLLSRIDACRASQATGTPGVTLDRPPKLPEFVWKEIKQPLHSQLTSHSTGQFHPQSPIPLAKRFKIDGPALTFPIGTYAEMQGTNINVDYETIQQIECESSILNYIEFCNFGDDPVDEIVSILLANCITSFKHFLFPEILNARIIRSWGICWGSAIELMTRARQFYVVQVKANDQHQSKGKGQVIDAQFEEY
ncbi:hypothetical protein DFH28DRAFT_1178153 [Melampsora americana]|nr:hypothetical protein DFH28DRAFT_1178153 [Melampsora americana]